MLWTKVASALEGLIIFLSYFCVFSLEESIEVVANWSGFAEHSMSDHSISLEYLTTDGPKLLLTLEFRISATGEALLMDAKVCMDH